MMERQGNTGAVRGGWSLVDPDGVAVSSWDPRLIGTRLAEPSDLAPVAPGQTPPSLANGTGRAVFAGLIPSISSPGTVYLTFVQPTDDFFPDLRAGRAVRDASFLLVVVAGIIGLAVLNHRRELAVRRSEQRLDALLQHAHDIVVVLDDEGRATFVSSAATGLLGYDPSERRRPVACWSWSTPTTSARLAARRRRPTPTRRSRSPTCACATATAATAGSTSTPSTCTTTPRSGACC